MLDDEIAGFRVFHDVERLALVKRCSGELVQTHIGEADSRSRDHVAVLRSEVDDHIRTFFSRRVAHKGVGSGVAPHDIVARPAVDGLVALSAQDGVIAVACVDLVRAGKGLHEVVAAQRRDDIIVVGSDDPFAKVGALDPLAWSANDAGCRAKQIGDYAHVSSLRNFGVSRKSTQL